MSEGNGFAKRDAFIGPPIRRFKEFEAEGFGKVRIRSLTELEQSRFDASALDKKGQLSQSKLVDMKCRLIVLCLVDGDGNQILTNADIESLRQQDAKYTNALAKVIQEHCGGDSVEFEDIEKNSEATAGASLH